MWTWSGGSEHWTCDGFLCDAVSMVRKAEEALRHGPVGQSRGMLRAPGGIEGEPKERRVVDM